jgi:hypothetical protein
MASMKSKIVEELASLFSTLDWVKRVNYENILIGFSGFRDHEIPAIQIIDLTNIRDPENQRDLNTWILSVQLIMKQKSTDNVNQSVLFDRMNDMITLVGQNTVLKITPDNPGDSFLQIRPIAEVTDLHSENPFYLAEINLEAMFYTGTRGGCGGTLSPENGRQP